MDALQVEIELRTQNFCRWVLEPGWVDYVTKTADRLAQLRPDLYADMKARVDAASQTTTPAAPGKATTGRAGS
jgi:hypothetical protein